MLSDNERKSMTIILGGHGQSFNAKLLRLIAEADPTNRELLRIAFPSEVAAFESWLHTPVAACQAGGAL